MNRHFKRFFLIMSLVYGIHSGASAQFFSYAKAFGGTNFSNTYSVEINTDVSGNVYTAGNFYGTVDFDPDTGIFNLTSAGWTDFYIARLDSTGNLIWAFSIGNTDDQAIQGFEFDLQGNLVVYGSFKNVVDFDPGPGVTNLTAPAGTSAALSSFIARYDTNGNLLMAKQITSAGFGMDVTINCLVVTNTDHLVALGSFKGTVDFDPGPAVNNLASTNRNTFILGLDAAGSFEWAKKVDNFESSIGWTAAAYDGDQSIYVSGNFANVDDFNPDPSQFNSLNAGSSYLNGFALKITTLGNYIWARNIGSPNSNENGNGITIDPALSGVYVTGHFYGTVTFDSLTSVVLNSPGNYTGFIMKLDSSGIFQWVNSFGGNSDDYMTHVTSDSYGVYATGKFSDTLDFYSSGSNIIVTASLANCFVCKYTHSGVPVWVYTFNNNSDDVFITDIHCDSQGFIYTTGDFETTTDFDPGPLTYNLVSQGGVDIFVHRTGMVNTTGNNETDMQLEYLLYPNPVTSSITIQLDKEYARIDLKVYSVAGKLMMEKEYKGQRIFLTDLSLLPGMYFFELTTSEGNLGTHKIIVK